MKRTSADAYFTIIEKKKLQNGVDVTDLQPRKYVA